MSLNRDYIRKKQHLSSLKTLLFLMCVILCVSDIASCFHIIFSFFCLLSFRSFRKSCWSFAWQWHPAHPLEHPAQLWLLKEWITLLIASKTIRQSNPPITISPISEYQIADNVDQQGNNISQTALECNRDQCPFGCTHFSADGPDGCKTWSTKEIEYHTIMSFAAFMKNNGNTKQTNRVIPQQN